MDYTLPPATRQKIDGPKGGNDSQNRDDLMNRLHSLVGCLAETQQTARNDHEQKKQSGDEHGSEADACELYTSVQSANGHHCGNDGGEREDFMDAGYGTGERFPRGPRVV